MEVVARRPTRLLRRWQKQLAEGGLRECTLCARVMSVGQFLTGMTMQSRCRECRLACPQRRKTPTSVGSKVCVDCNEPKSLTEFYAHGKMADGRMRRCIACELERRRRQRQSPLHPALTRRCAAIHLDPQVYLQMREWQENACAICGASFDDVALNLDHDHESGHHRGLLCTRCNQGLGFFRDDPSLLQRAISYLWEWQVEANAMAGRNEEAAEWRDCFPSGRA